MIAAYAVHVLAAAAWAGSLPALAIVLRRTRNDAKDVHATLVGYSRLAAPCAALVVLSGTANTLFHARSAAALVGSAWGAVLAVKLALVAAMLALAAVVRWWFVPRLRVRAAGGVTGLALGSVASEAALAVAVFGAAAVLGITPPPR